MADSTSGIAAMQISQIDTTTQRLSSQIDDMTTRITNMQQDMLSRLQQADALLSHLESQQGLLDATINSLNFVSYGYQKSQSGG
jgi:flagellar capping protein FliD